MGFDDDDDSLVDQNIDIDNLKQEIDGDLIEAGLFKDTQSRSLDFLVSLHQEVAEHWQAPTVEVQVTLPVELTECFDDALGEVGGAVSAPLSQQIPCR